jgi:hypothetical protein
VSKRDDILDRLAEILTATSLAPVERNLAVPPSGDDLPVLILWDGADESDPPDGARGRRPLTRWRMAPIIGFHARSTNPETLRGELNAAYEAIRTGIKNDAALLALTTQAHDLSISMTPLYQQDAPIAGLRLNLSIQYDL